MPAVGDDGDRPANADGPAAPTPVDPGDDVRQEQPATPDPTAMSEPTPTPTVGDDGDRPADPGDRPAYSGDAGNILIYGENTNVTAKGKSGGQDIGHGLAGDGGNVFVAAGTVEGSSGPIGNAVAFTANPDSSDVVTAELPAPFAQIDLLTGLNASPKALQVYTTFSNQQIEFALPGYALVTRKADELKITDAKVIFTHPVPPPVVISTAAAPTARPCRRCLR